MHPKSETRLKPGLTVGDNLGAKCIFSSAPRCHVVNDWQRCFIFLCSIKLPEFHAGQIVRTHVAAFLTIAIDMPRRQPYKMWFLDSRNLPLCTQATQKTITRKPRTMREKATGCRSEERGSVGCGVNQERKTVVPAHRTNIIFAVLVWTWEPNHRRLDPISLASTKLLTNEFEIGTSKQDTSYRLGIHLQEHIQNQRR